MYWLAAACVILTGCGRVGFGEIAAADGDVDAEGDGGGPASTAVEVTPPTFSTMSPTFVDITGGSLVVPPSPGQQWLLLVSASLRSTSLDYAGPEVRYLVDGVERGIGGTESVVANLPGPWQHFYLFDGGGAPTTIQFQARDTLAATTVISDLRAVAVPLPAATAPEYVAFDGPTSVNEPVAAPVHTFALDIEQDGDYVFLLLANQTEAPGSSDIETQWFDPDGVAWASTLQNPRGAWQSSLLMRRRMLDAGTHNIEVHAQSGAMASIAYARVLALRVDGFAGRFAFVATDVDDVTASATPDVASTLDLNLPQSSKYIALGTVRVDDDCANSMLAVRRAQFAFDDIMTSIAHVPGNCASETTYGFVALRSEPPVTFAATYSSGNGMNVEHEESALLVVGLP